MKGRENNIPASFSFQRYDVISLKSLRFKFVNSQRGDEKSSKKVLYMVYKVVYTIHNGIILYFIINHHNSGLVL